MADKEYLGLARITEIFTLLKNKFSDKVDKKTTVDTYYGTCSTAADEAAKVATITDAANNFSLRPGVTVTIKFTETNTAQNPTLNVNNTGAKSIWYNVALITTSNLGLAAYADRYIRYIYDGTQWVWIGWSVDHNTTYSNMSASELATGTATTARSISAKVLNDWLDDAISPILDTVEDIEEVTALPADAAQHPTTLYLIKES